MGDGIKGSAFMEKLSGKQVAIIDEVGTALDPPATDAEFLDVRSSMNDKHGEITFFMDQYLDSNLSEQAELEVTRIIAGIAYAAIRSESEG